MRKIDPEELVGNGIELGKRFDDSIREEIKERRSILIEIYPPKLKWHYL